MIRSVVPVVGAASSCMAKSYRVVVGALVGGEDNFDHFKVPKSLRDVIEAAAAALANVQCGESLNKSCMDLSTALKSLLSAFHDVAKQASSLAKSLPDAAKALLLSPNLKIKGLKAAAHGFATTLKLGSRFIAPLVHLTNNKEKLMETWEAMKTLAAPLEELVNNHPELQDQVEAIREDLVETEGNVEQIVQGVLDSATSALNDDCIPFLKMVDQWLLDLSYLKPSKALKAAVAAGGVTVSEVMRTAASQDRLDPAQADDNLKELSEAAIESLRSACLQ